jgi:hypothetical protein
MLTRSANATLPDGVPTAEVDGFLRLLAVREYSPNTIWAYAHDLQKLFAFLAGLSHCLRLPQEGPCAGDLHLTCAKFVTTCPVRAAAPRAPVP